MFRAIDKVVLGVLLTIVVGVVFHAPLTVWLGSVWPEAQMEIKAWKEVLLLAATALVAVEVTRRRLWRSLLGDWVIRLAALYGVLHVVMLAWMWQGVSPAVAALMIDLRFVLFFVVMYAAVRLWPQWRRPVVMGSLAAAVAAMLFAVLQVTVLPHDILSYIGYSRETIAPYLTVDQNYDFIRINGTLRGPNPLGAYAAMVIAAALAALVFAWQRMTRLHKYLPWMVATLMVMATVALWFSYSRSAKIAAVVAVGVVLVSRYGSRLNKGVWYGLIAAAMLVAGGLYVARDSHVVSHVILHEDPNEGNDVNSNDGHWESLVDGTERMISQPLGAGVGSTGSPSLMGESPLIIENYFLYVAHEVGWLGLGLFVALGGGVLWRLWQRRGDWLALSLLGSGAGLMVASLFLPVWADDTVAMVWWGLAGVAIAAPVAVEKMWKDVKKRGQL